MKKLNTLYFTRLFACFYSISLKQTTPSCEYDKLNRIKKATNSNKNEAIYPYDQLGNRIGKRMTFQQRFISISVFLEGVYNLNTELMTTILTDQGLLPLNQSFNSSQWNHFGVETLFMLFRRVCDWLLVLHGDSDYYFNNKWKYHDA